MRAAVWHGREDVRVEEVPEPGPPGPGMVLVRVRWCGICGSDLHEYLAGPIFIPTRPHPLTGRQAPIILGHEFAGVVEAVGERVTHVAVGDRVTAGACWRCGECYWCQRGQYNLCKKLGSTGLGADGAFAQYLTIPGYTVFALPPEVSDEAGALVEPLAVGLHAVRRGGVSPGDTVAIVGAGPIGLGALQGARAAGAARVFVLELAEGRRRLAQQLGAEVLDPQEGEVVRQLFRLTDGIGADVSIECVGSPHTAPLAIELARRGGTVAIAGIFEGPSQLHFNRLVFYEKQVRGSIAYAGEFPAVLALLADGRLQAEPLITARIELSDIIEGGFKELAEHKDRHAKILVSPQG